MYSKEETQRLKREFWIAFAETYPHKWLLYDTKIKDFSFKFSADNKKAAVMIDIEPRDTEKRYAYFEKIQSFAAILKEEHVDDLVYERDFHLETGKVISRIWTEQTGLSMNNRKDWPMIFSFFNEKMMALEYFFHEYSDIIRDI